MYNLTELSDYEFLWRTDREAGFMYRCCEWCELENVRYFYEFFKKHEKEFEE